MNDRHYMKQALTLAARGAGTVSPNPMVGAVLVHNHQVIAQGYHRQFGGPHAEVDALSQILSIPPSATLYVNLEPCSHFGKTPPCASAIIAAGIQRVVVAMKDPNPQVSGRGLAMLREAGIEVQIGVLEEEARKLNAPFIKFITQQLPYVTLKVAQTLDGKTALTNGQSKWITSETSRKKVHRLRHETDAVLVGIGTVLADNPRLDVRLVPGQSGRRFILDPRLQTPDDVFLLQPSHVHHTTLVTMTGHSKESITRFLDLGVTVWELEPEQNRIPIHPVLKRMAKENIQHLLVEGGSRVFSSFLKSGLTDRLLMFIAPKLFGQGFDPFCDLSLGTPEDAPVFKTTQWKKSGADLLFEGRF